MKKTSGIILGLMIVVFFASCDNTTKKNDSNEEQVNTESNETQVAEDFDEFYDKFVTDEEFQLERVNFPLRGGDISEDGTLEWTKDDWYMIQDIRTVDLEEFEVFTEKKDTKVTHEIQLPNSGFGGDLTYEVIDGKWYLTEYNIYNF